MSNLAKVKSERFGDIVCDFWKNESGEIFMTTDQLGRALGYSEPVIAINKLVARNPYLASEEFSTITRLVRVEGSRQVARDVRVFTEDGIYEVTFLANTEQAQKFRRWVRQILKGLRKGEIALQYKLPQNYEEALEQLLESVRERRKLAEQNAVLAPKAEMYDTYMNSEGLLTINEAAKALNIPGVGQKKLFQILRKEGVFYKKGGQNLPYQRYIERGYFVVKEKTFHIGEEPQIYHQPHVTPKGFDWLVRFLRDRGYIAMKVVV